MDYCFENQNDKFLDMLSNHEFNINAVPAKALTRIAAVQILVFDFNGKLVVLEGAKTVLIPMTPPLRDEVDIAPHPKART